MGDVKEEVVSNIEVKQTIQRQKNIIEKTNQDDKFEYSSEASWDKPSPPTEEQVK